MRNIVKWGGLAVLLVALLAVGGAAVMFRTVTPSSGTADMAGLNAPVRIVRDENAVAHIEAGSHRDAVRALGYTHAQERLWQMDQLRRAASGRLSELFGEQTVGVDTFLRTLGLERAAAGSYAVLKPETRALLDAYSEGVNAWVNRDRAMLEPALPPEFLVFGADFRPWTGADSVAVLKLMSLQLSQNMRHELDRLVLAARGFTSGEISDLFPVHRDDRPPPLPDLARLLPLRPPADVLSAERETAALTAVLEPAVARWASNSWVLQPGRTTTDGALLANDPHLAFSAPSLWYLAHMSWEADGEPRTLVGATLPGTPGVLLGRNADVAWGFTNAGADVQDLFIEQVQAGDPNRYLTPNGWRTFGRRSEVIAVAGGEPVTIDVRLSRHGPVLPDELPLPSAAPVVFSDLLRELYVPALRWTGLSATDRTMDAIVALADARNVAELQTAFSGVQSPMQAIVMADRAGDIALATPARVPVRADANLVRGRAPVPGWLPEYDWQRVIEGPDVPSVRNPASGAFVTANSRLPTADRLFTTYDWDESLRLDRAEELVAARPRHDVASMRAIQNDTRSHGMERLRDRLLALAPPPEPYRGELVAWDGRMDRDARAPLLMAAWAKALIARLLEDDLGTAFPRFENVDHFALERMLEGGARDWCDRRDTARPESCAEIAAAAWDVAVADLRQRFGEDPNGWTWGRAHFVRNAHRPFDAVPLLRPLFNVERPAAGGPHTLNRGQVSFGSDTPYATTHGAGYKAVYDLASPERSLFIQTTGQSGNPFSPHYRDLADLWANGAYISIRTDGAAYRERARGEWVLRPATGSSTTE